MKNRFKHTLEKQTYRLTVLYTLRYTYTYTYTYTYVYGSRSKGPRKGFKLPRPAGFQHETPRPFFFLSSRKYFFG